MTAPAPPPFRVTLFYGPEPLDADDTGQRCVFNVKKRSWKAGVQVVVEVAAAQLDEARRQLALDAWLTEVLASVEPAERDAYARRAEELFVQAVCTLKLDLALERGLTQENQRLERDALVPPLRDGLPAARGRIIQHISDELDLVGR